MASPKPWAAVALVCLLLAGCGGRAADRPEAVAPEPTPAAVTAPQPSPTPHPPPEPFEVVVEHLEMIPANNAEIAGTSAPPADHGQVELAVDRSRRVLQRFLDAQFVAEGTRFTTAAMHDLLTPEAQAALTPVDRRGLGALHLSVGRVETGPARARAQVVFDGAEVQLVTLSFSAELRVGFGNRRATLPVHQRGQLAYVPTDAGWRVAAADVRLDAPPRPRPSGPMGVR